VIVIISGNTATGKTTVGQQLAARLGLRFYSKDQFKEDLFARHRRHKLMWWQWYDRRAKGQLFDQIARSQKAGEPIIVESNFEPHDRKRLRSVIKSDQAIELYFYAQPGTVLRRYIARLKTDEKHPAHYDWLWVPLTALYSGLSVLGYDRFKPTGATKTIQYVDTTDFSKVSVAKLAKSIRRQTGVL
jgi:predicted kinase